MSPSRGVQGPENGPTCNLGRVTSTAGPADDLGRRSISFDRIADVYDATRGGMERGESTAADLADWIVPGTIVEVGVGTGVVAKALADRLERTVLGFDVSPKMTVQARARLGDVVSVGDVERLPIATASLRTVVAVWVLHVVGDLDAVLAECARVLEPGGRLVTVAGWRAMESDDIDAVASGLLGSELRPGHDIQLVQDMALAAGFGLVAGPLTTERHWELSPNEEANRIEHRMYGPLLDISVETFEAVTRPVIEALRALPEPDRPRRRVARHPFLVLERSG